LVDKTIANLEMMLSLLYGYHWSNDSLVIVVDMSTITSE